MLELELELELVLGGQLRDELGRWEDHEVEGLELEARTESRKLMGGAGAGIPVEVYWLLV